MDEFFYRQCVCVWGGGGGVFLTSLYIRTLGYPLVKAHLEGRDNWGLKGGVITLSAGVHKPQLSVLGRIYQTVIWFHYLTLTIIVSESILNETQLCYKKQKLPYVII